MLENGPLQEAGVANALCKRVFELRRAGRHAGPCGALQDDAFVGDLFALSAAAQRGAEFEVATASAAMPATPACSPSALEGWTPMFGTHVPTSPTAAFGQPQTPTRRVGPCQPAQRPHAP